MMACGAGDTAVAGQKRRAERFGKRDIDSVIGGKIGAQLPHARQEDVMRVPPD
jgi:hypothetical protein